MKKLLSVLLVLTMCLSVMTFTVSAAELEDVVYTDSRGNQITIPGGAASCATKVVEFTHGDPWTTDPLDIDPNEILGVPDRGNLSNGKAITLGAGGVIVLEFDIFITDGEGLDIYVFEVGQNVEATKVEVSSDLQNWVYVGDADGSLCGVDLNGKVPEGAKYKYVRITDLLTTPNGGYPGADIDAVAGLNAKVPASGSEWANEELEKADMLGLIPEVLEDADLAQDITRAEFAAVAVKVYENLSGTAAIPAVINPFTDTKDVEILKAYNIGAVNGTSATTYSPDDLLNREQAAAMLTRVFKKISIPNWTLATDSQFTLPYEKPALFADDADISDWAKDSVYFMVANGIINGVGDNKFAPKNVTSADEANGYANATREQALIIAVRMVENLKK